MTSMRRGHIKAVSSYRTSVEATAKLIGHSRLVFSTGFVEFYLNYPYADTSQP